mgnify:CR=1 FL=1
MKISNELLMKAKQTVETYSEARVLNESIISIGCFGCGLGCSDTVGG